MGGGQGGVEHLAKINEFCVTFFVHRVMHIQYVYSSEKNNKHSVNNQYMQFGAGYDEAAVFAQVGKIRNEVGVIELHDCFVANELDPALFCTAHNLSGT